MLLIAVSLGILAALPSIWPDRFPYLHGVKVDTDPENMLSEHEPVRLFHDHMKKELALYDMIVVGVVNEHHPEGVFNPQSLKNIYELTEYAKTLHWSHPENPEQQIGVIDIDIIAPSTVDNVQQGGPGTVKFEWLMSKPPETLEDAIAIREKAQRLPFLNDTLVSQDGHAIGLYIPVTSKDLSYQIAEKLKKKIASFAGSDQYYITGLPVAEDTFGVQMFKQMAISAPLAMLVIFILMLFFFRNLILIVSPMIVALVSIVCTMGLLVISGKTIHIMSSMIPIFITPIAVLDAIHILSEFFDRFQETKDRRKTIIGVMETLFMPMFFTSVTTVAGFASLALTPIPPVQVFGIFVSFGVIMAWLWTITFIPAYVMLIPEKALENFGMNLEHKVETQGLMGRLLGFLGGFTFKRHKWVLTGTVVIMAVSAWGISLISINDNPTRWFESKHPIRVADRVLNEHFGGTYMGYLALEPEVEKESFSQYTDGLHHRLTSYYKEKIDVPHMKATVDLVANKISELRKTLLDKNAIVSELETFIDSESWSASEDYYPAWDAVLMFISREKNRDEIFKQPEALNYIERLQETLLKTGIVGKSNALPDLVKTVHRELYSGKKDQFRIPDSSRAVAQTLLTFQNSHRPDDLWHFVTPDYRKTSIWVQLTSGDNRDMAKVVQAIDHFVMNNPPPFSLQHRWFGLTYINVVWQEKMVSGMLQAFLGSFLVVLLMMITLFRSALWGLFCMIPLTVTIALIYGITGIIGKDYDMPTAVLSSLSLGLAVDYAIHFLSRSRGLREEYGTWKSAVSSVFGEPARAITRNVIVVGIGFLPLLAAPLVPYKTVGTLIAAILIAAGLATLLILPSLIRWLEAFLFPEGRSRQFACNCGTCLVTATCGVGFVALNLNQFLSVGWTVLSLFSAVGILILFGVCYLLSRRQACEP